MVTSARFPASIRLPLKGFQAGPEVIIFIALSKSSVVPVVLKSDKEPLKFTKNETFTFHDDKKDAGEMGSGHTVTAIYEIVPNGVESDYLAKTDDLKYQQNTSSEQGKQMSY